MLTIINSPKINVQVLQIRIANLGLISYLYVHVKATNHSKVFFPLRLCLLFRMKLFIKLKICCLYPFKFLVSLDWKYILAFISIYFFIYIYSANETVSKKLIWIVVMITDRHNKYHTPDWKRHRRCHQVHHSQRQSGLDDVNSRDYRIRYLNRFHLNLLDRWCIFSKQLLHGSPTPSKSASSWYGLTISIRAVMYLIGIWLL